MAPYYAAAINPLTRSAYWSTGAAIAVSMTGCLPCAGGAGGGARGLVAMAQGCHVDITGALLAGATSGAITQGLSMATGGDIFISTVLGGIIGGAASAAIEGGNVVQGAIIGASVGAFSAYIANLSRLSIRPDTPGFAGNGLGFNDGSFGPCNGAIHCGVSQTYTK